MDWIVSEKNRFDVRCNTENRRKRRQKFPLIYFVIFILYLSRVFLIGELLDFPAWISFLFHHLCWNYVALWCKSFHLVSHHFIGLWIIEFKQSRASQKSRKNLKSLKASLKIKIPKVIAHLRLLKIELSPQSKTS